MNSPRSWGIRSSITPPKPRTWWKSAPTRTLSAGASALAAGNVAVANKTIVERVIAPMLVGQNPLERERLWHGVYNLLRDHGQKGMPLQALSGVDIALWDIAGKFYNAPLCQLVGGKCRERVPVYGYGMMLRREKNLAPLFAEEAAALEARGFRAVKMKIGRGAREDIRSGGIGAQGIKG